jgi:hypothetical protein
MKGKSPRNIQEVAHSIVSEMRVLKEYPFVPAVFFILFAWSILYVVTPYKPALRERKIMDTSPAIWQHDDSLAQDWQLRITEQYIHFRETPTGVWQVFTYHTLEHPVLMYEGTSTTRKAHIKIFILPKKKNKKSEAIIVQEDRNFYGVLMARERK